MTENATWENLEKRLAQPGVQLGTLAVITLIAAGLRFYKLGEWSFWYDEIFTLRSIGVLEGTSFTSLTLSKSLIYLVVSNFGVTEWFSRLIPALMGIATIPILYFPVKAIFNAPTALLSSLLLTISTWHLYWSQNARFYTTILLFFSLGLFAFYYFIERDRPEYLIIFMVLLGLAVKERLFAVFMVPIILLYLVGLRVLPFERPAGLKFRRNLLYLFIPSIIFGLILGWEYILDPGRYFEGFGTVNSGPFWILAGVIYYVGLPILIMGSLGGVYLLLVKRDRAVFLLALAALVPLLAVMGLSLFQYSANRYIFISLSSWVILTSAGLYELFKLANNHAKILAVGILLLLVLEPLSEDALYFQYQNGNRDNWKAAFQLIEQDKADGDIVVVSEPLVGNYYLEETTAGIESFDLNALDGSENRVWFVEDNNVGLKSPEKLNWIEANAKLLANFDVDVRARKFKMRVYLFDPG